MVRANSATIKSEQECCLSRQLPEARTWSRIQMATLQALEAERASASWRRKKMMMMSWGEAEINHVNARLHASLRPLRLGISFKIQPRFRLIELTFGPKSLGPVGGRAGPRRRLVVKLARAPPARVRSIRRRARAKRHLSLVRPPFVAARSITRPGELIRLRPAGRPTCWPAPRSRRPWRQARFNFRRRPERSKGASLRIYYSARQASRSPARSPVCVRVCAL